MKNKIDIKRSCVYRWINAIYADWFLNQNGYFCNDKNFSENVVFGKYVELNQKHRKCFKCGSDFYKFFIPDLEVEFVTKNKIFKKARMIKTREEFINLTGCKEGDELLVRLGCSEMTVIIGSFHKEKDGYHGDGLEFKNYWQDGGGENFSFSILSRNYMNSPYDHRFFDKKNNKWRKFLIYQE